jgi:hypothetical protein
VNQMEKACLGHAATELRYQRSQKARDDLAADIARRNRLMISQGHSLKCGIMKCHPECKKEQATMARYKIISLRSQAKGYKQRDVKSAGTFGTYEEACQVAEKMNQDTNRIYTTYMAQKEYGHGPQA